MSYGKKRQSRSWLFGLFGGKKPAPVDDPPVTKRVDKIVDPTPDRPIPKPVARADLTPPTSAAPAELPPVPAVETSVVAEPVAAEPAAAESAPGDPVGTLIASIVDGAEFVFLPTAENGAKQPLQHACATDERGRPLVKLSEGAADARSNSKTGGYSIRVPDKFEAAVSGKTIKVSVVARGDKGAARFAVAYSTNDVGNSGWRWFNATPEWSAFEMIYRVPVMKNAKGDFIGLLPTPAGTPGIEVYAVSAATVPPRGETT